MQAIGRFLEPLQGASNGVFQFNQLFRVRPGYDLEQFGIHGRALGLAAAQLGGQQVIQ